MAPPLLDVAVDDQTPQKLSLVGEDEMSKMCLEALNEEPVKPYDSRNRKSAGEAHCKKKLARSCKKRPAAVVAVGEVEAMYADLDLSWHGFQK